MKKLAVAVFASIVASGVARAEEPRLPFNPFEKAQKGDWAASTGTFRREGAGEKKMPCANYARVVRLEGEKVVVSEVVQVGSVEKASKAFSTKTAPTVMEYFDLKDGTIDGLKVEDDKRKVCEKELACKKLHFVWKHDQSEDEITAWLSPEVKAGGLAAFSIKGRRKGKVELDTTIKMELAGSGSADKKDLGDAPEDVLDADLLGEPEEAIELPFDIFAKLKKGDWAAIRIDADMGGGSEAGVASFEVVKLEKGSIELESTRHGRDRGNDSSTVKLDASKPLSALTYISMIVKGSPHSSDKPPAVSGVKVTDEKKTVGDREFDCKRLSFTFKEHGRTNVRVKLWVSPEVKLGFVAAEIRAREGDRALAIDMEIGGWGDDDKTEWGKTAELLVKKRKKKKDDE